MSSVTPVPETTTMAGEQLTADDAWRTVRDCGWTIWREAFARFRYGDGFSHARALGLQLCLAFIPLVIALVGLSGTLATERIGQVLRLTLVSLSPGASDGLLQNTLDRPVQNGGDGRCCWWPSRPCCAAPPAGGSRGCRGWGWAPWSRWCSGWCSPKKIATEVSWAQSSSAMMPASAEPAGHRDIDGRSPGWLSPAR